MALLTGTAATIATVAGATAAVGSAAYGIASAEKIQSPSINLPMTVYLGQTSESSRWAGNQRLIILRCSSIGS
mgnify:CR=1 FL=1